MENLIETFTFHRYEGSGDTSGGKLNPSKVKSQSRGDTIVSLLYASAAGDLATLKTHKVQFQSTLYSGKLRGSMYFVDIPTYIIYNNRV